jgi:glycosyltransferase involved in cell wall biosynthesis
MKIGIVVDNELNNDIRVLREIGILKEQGFEIFVLCFGFSRTYNDPISQIHVTRINISKKVRDILFFLLNTIPVYEWFWALKIRKFIINNQIEILHAHDLYMARAAYNGIKKTGLKVSLILDLHENYPFTVRTYNWTKGFLRRLISRPDDWKKKEREYLRYADRIIVLSNDFRDALLKQYPELVAENFVVLPNVPDLSKPEYKSKVAVTNPFRQGFPIIFYYGVIAERRGIFEALRVFADLVKEGYPVNFLLIGPVDKMDQALFSELTSLELLANRIHYIPWIESKEFPDYLRICDICIAPFHKNPQHESGVANKIYDYMLGGKPIIASNCKPQQNLIEKHNCGMIFENIGEFHDAIVMLLNDKPLREKMGENGRNAVMREYNTEIVKGNLILLFNTLSLIHKEHL